MKEVATIPNLTQTSTSVHSVLVVGSMGSHRVFLGGLPNTITEHALVAECLKHLTLPPTKVHIIRRRQQQHCPYALVSAFVTTQSTEDQQNLIQALHMRSFLGFMLTATVAIERHQPLPWQSVPIPKPTLAPPAFKAGQPTTHQPPVPPHHKHKHHLQSHPAHHSHLTSLTKCLRNPKAHQKHTKPQVDLGLPLPLHTPLLLIQHALNGLAERKGQKKLDCSSSGPKVLFLKMELHTGTCEGRGIFQLDYHGEHNGVPQSCDCCELLCATCKEEP